MLKSLSQFLIINAQNVDQLIMNFNKVLEIEPETIYGQFLEMISGLDGFEIFANIEITVVLKEDSQIH